MARKTRVYLGWPSTGTREDVHVYLLRNLQDRYGDKVELVLPEQCVHRIFHDRARCDIVEEFLASDCDVLWMLDSDVVPPDHVLDLVVHHQDKWQVAGCPYPIYSMVPGTGEMAICFTVYKGMLDGAQGHGVFMADVPQEGTDFVDALATGCLFIKREVFKQIEKPYFEFKFDKESRRITEGEDLGFAFKLHALGIKFFVDYAMPCKHLKRVCLLDMCNYAMKRANQRVLEYDKEIREKVQGAIAAAYQAGIKKGVEESQMGQGVAHKKTQSGLILPQSFAR